MNVQLNVEKLLETENYIPDQIRQTMSISIENRKPTVKIEAEKPQFFDTKIEKST
jgi:hypothetical protein